jgi:ankyrin repeat protein
VRLLLDRGANIHALDDYALQLSASNGYIDVTRLLLDRGANIHANDDEALRISAYNGHVEVVRLLLDRGANIHAEDDEALQTSAMWGYVKVVQLLLDRGANIHANNEASLRWGARNGHLEVVRLLLDSGAGIYSFNNERYYHTDNIRCLLSVYNVYHDDLQFLKAAKLFGLIRRPVNVKTLEQLCRKSIIIKLGCVSDKIELFLPNLAEKKFNSVVPDYLRVPPPHGQKFNCRLICFFDHTVKKVYEVAVGCQNLRAKVKRIRSGALTS